jgi:hypothetical protein
MGHTPALLQGEERAKMLRRNNLPAIKGAKVRFCLLWEPKKRKAAASPTSKSLRAAGSHEKMHKTPNCAPLENGHAGKFIGAWQQKPAAERSHKQSNPTISVYTRSVLRKPKFCANFKP